MTDNSEESCGCKNSEDNSESGAGCCNQACDASAEDKISSLELQLAESHQRYLRALADFENLNKRNLKERSELMKYQGERIIIDLLEVIDNFDLALQHSDADHQKFKKGVELIHKLFMDLLQKWEVKSVSAIGEKFNPETHGALSKVPCEEGIEPGQVVAEFRKAYFYKEKLIRPGEVVVASGE